MVTIVEINEVLETVFDPEVPVLSILDLGVVRKVFVEKGIANIVLTPTYSGCPAMDTIIEDTRKALVEAGIENAVIEMELHPAWTTDWISEKGKEKLLLYGIAPPVEPLPNANVMFADNSIINCPQCKSKDTVMISLFGSTACKALYKCNICLEPFDYFKCLR